jgi:hypothetical protein
MKILKTIPETVRQKTVVDKVICDICKNSIEPESNYDYSEVNIEAVLGSAYPDSDCRTLYIIDVCPNCFMNKVKPLIEKEYGIEFREIDNEDRYLKFE